MKLFSIIMLILFIMSAFQGGFFTSLFTGCIILFVWLIVNAIWSSF